MKRLIQKIAVFHRYAGLLGSVFFTLWFVSGVFMLYVEMPYFRQSAEAYAGDPPLNPRAVRLTPSAAYARTKLREAPARIRLAMLLDRPVYRFLPADDGDIVTIFADDGQRLAALTPGLALHVARDFEERYEKSDHRRLQGNSELTPETAVDLIAVDQWTLHRNDFAAQRPFYRFAKGDTAGAEIYVSQVTGKVVQRTTRIDRMLAWAGPVLHWIYFASLRQHASLWSTTVLWISGAGMCVAFTGLTLGFWRMRSTKKRKLTSPFRERWMRWHHWLGLLFGFVTCTWIFSGWMSMTPFDWAPGTSANSTEAGILRGGELRPSLFDSLREDLQTLENSTHPPGTIREVELIQLAGQPRIRLILQDPNRPAEFRSEVFPPITSDQVCTIPQSLHMDSPVTECRMLTEWDAYYFAKPGTRFQRRILPVVRVSFADTRRHSYYIAPATGKIVLRHESRSRWNRWLYNGLHSFSLPVLYQSRPVWDILMLILLAGGLGLSLTSIVLTLRKFK